MAIVDIRDGKLEGQRQDGLHAFLDIPFAAPPLGAKRWRAPEAPAPWSGVREADGFGRQAWQIMIDAPGPLSFAFNARAAGNRDEDCLYLNVWTPGIDSRKRPVLVWIHGGGFTAGTGGTPMYDGSALAKRGNAVVVTINHRLGALGFLNLNEVTGGRIPATGNEGMLDQVKALESVRDNIEAFGGDPRRVTIFGESAGGMSVGVLLAFGPAKGLFHRAIPQSGACSTAVPLARSNQIARGLIDRLGFSANDAVDRLMKLRPEELITTAAMQASRSGLAVMYPRRNASSNVIAPHVRNAVTASTPDRCSPRSKRTACSVSRRSDSPKRWRHAASGRINISSSGSRRSTTARSVRHTYAVATRATAIFDDPVAIKNDPFGKERAIWDEVGAEVGVI